MQALNSYLLRTFSNNEKVTPDIQNQIKRYYALSIIYINAGVGFFIFIWTILPYFGFGLSGHGQAYIIFPLIASSIFSLKKGKNGLAAWIVLFYCHVTSLYVNVMHNMPMVSMFFGITTVSCCFMLSNSKKLFLCNLFVCISHNAFITMRLQEAFRITFTQEQSDLILQLQSRSFSILVFLGIVAYAQKGIETSLWKLAHDNYERTLSVTKEIVEAAEAKDTFVSSLSYEIQSPLNNMRGTIDTLLKMIRDQAHVQALKTMKLNSEILLNVVSNLLDIAKLRSDKIELNFKESGSIDLVKKLMMVYADSLKEKEISTQVCIDRTLPSVLWIDPSRLLQIILNIFSNALKFTPHGGKIYLTMSWSNYEQNESSLLNFMRTNNEENHIERRAPLVLNPSQTEPPLISSDRSSWTPQTFDEFSIVEASVRDQNLKNIRPFQVKTLEQVPLREMASDQKYLVWRMDGKAQQAKNTQRLLESLFAFAGQQENVAEKGYLIVSITDTGYGIPEHVIPRLFERFSQINRSAPQTYRDSGFGLWMSKQLCKKMGGDIAVESCLNQGSTFAFYIPVNNVHLIEASRNRARVSRDKIRALVVDDYAYNRDLHKLLVEREGVQQVVTACDGKEAVERYLSKGDDYYDFIMMDVQMPEMDGFTAAKKIRQYEEEKKWKRVDIYFVSGEYYSEEDIVSELRTKGQMDTGIRCLRKPLGIEMIRKIVQKYMAERGDANSDGNGNQN